MVTIIIIDLFTSNLALTFLSVLTWIGLKVKGNRFERNTFESSPSAMVKYIVVEIVSPF